MKIPIAIMKLTTRVILSIKTDWLILNMSIPTQDVNGPGIIGRKLPMIPKRIKNQERKIKNISTLQKYWNLILKKDS